MCKNNKSIIIISLLTVVISLLSAQADIRRMVYYDPYTIAFDEDDFGGFAVEDSNFYARQVAVAGFNTAVTYSNNFAHISAMNQVGVQLMNMFVGESALWLWNGHEEIWPLGLYPDENGDPVLEKHISGAAYSLVNGIIGVNADYYTDPGENNGGSDRHVIQSLPEIHEAGVVLDGSAQNIAAGRWINENYVFLRVTAKIDTAGLNVDSNTPVAAFYVYEGSNSRETELELETMDSHSLLAMQKSMGGFHPDQRDHHLNEVLLTVSDFQQNDAYVTFTSDTLLLSPNPVTRVDVEWFGDVEFNLDGFELRSIYNHLLYTSPDTTAARTYVKGLIYNHFGTAGYNPDNIYRWYFDEPRVNMYSTLGKISDLAQDTTGIRLAVGTPEAHDDDIIKYRMYDFVNPEQLIYHSYPIKGSYTSHNSDDFDGYGTRTIQQAWDALSAKLMTVSTQRPGFPQPALPWVYINQVQGEKLPNGSIRFRDPLPGEISAQTWLALAHDAKAIMCFIYGTFQTPWGSVLFHGLVDIDANGDGIGNDTDIYDPSLGPYVPNYKYYAVQDMNRDLELLSDIILNLEWLNTRTDAEGIDENLVTDYSFIESVTSAEFETPYIEIANFTDPQNENYFLLLNRRVCTDTTNTAFNLGGECTGDETQTISVNINPDSPALLIEDLLAIRDDEDTGPDTYDILDHSFQLTLKPGEGRLYRVHKYGCLNPTALNYDPYAFEDSGNCSYATPGDLNQDGNVNIVDVIQMIDIILNNEFSDYELLAGDLFVDGVISIMDVVILVEIILNS